MAERVVDRLEAIDIEHDQRGGGLIALDVGDRAVELALKAAPVQDTEQEVGFGACLQGLDLRLGLGEFRPQPANRRLGVACGRGPRCRRRQGTVWRRFTHHNAGFAAFRGSRCGRPALLLHNHPC
jgi:hypothetical protein